MAHLIYRDTIAVLGISQRQGSRIMMHVDRMLLLVQDFSAKTAFQFSDIPGATTPVDLGTKGLPAEAINRHIEFARGELCSGMPVLCLISL